MKNQDKRYILPIDGIVCTLHLNLYNVIQIASGGIQGVLWIFSLSIFLRQIMHRNHLGVLQCLKEETTYLGVIYSSFFSQSSV